MRCLFVILFLVCLQSLAAQKAVPAKEIPNLPASHIAGIVQKDTLQNEDDTHTISFVRAGSLIVIQATADTTTGNFILDTGAPGLVLNLTYFRQYKHTEVGDRNSMSGAVVGAVQTLVGKFSFCGLDYKNLDADMIGLGHIEDKKGIKILGLIGVSFFKDCEMTIDYETNLIHLHRMDKKARMAYKPVLPDTAKFTTLNFDIIDNKIITVAKLGDKKMKFFLDSGAESNVLDSRLPNKVFESITITGRSRLIGAGNKPVEALYGNMSNLTMGSKQLRELPFVITNLENACISEVCCIDGILGFNSLSARKVGFNFIKKEMYLWK